MNRDIRAQVIPPKTRSLLVLEMAAELTLHYEGSAPGANAAGFRPACA